MNKSIIIRRLLFAPPTLRSTFVQKQLFSPQSRQYAVQSITQPSFWTNMIPKPFRKSERAVSKRQKSKDWNPATFFIWIFLLIGSMSIQMIALRNEYATFSRRADAKIAVLRELIQRIRNGEKPDVEALLGVGDREQEREWEEVLQEIEREAAALQQAPPKKSNSGNAAAPETREKTPEQPKNKSSGPSGFY
ncbi:hypothetical protein sscle_06g049930 [Sclerotinia sclerotiorum 1980 UF-70]|uniref:Uncharacterized protein n=1 Tax=Sclerotinia sclerotiorum (strain ATCC 18683 / 1980 / Ss-1) TaxID=665079 RepID=A0A1D9Q6L4_SCLS1|nr:hypothetical protein sscle_06g049930 [Sclerotinia sclerotiorum 1980 UF-70]